jgi:hypothetical protein
MKVPAKYLVSALFLASSALIAQNNQTGACDPSVTTCSTSNQNVGNISPISTATNSTSGAAQSNNSADANGAQVNPTINNTPQQEQSQGNASQTLGNAQQTNQGGNTSGQITGGNTQSGASANGNQSANNSSAAVGPTSSNSGGNKTTSGATATTGNNTNKNTATGGKATGGVASSVAQSAGGAGGAGGVASTVTQSTTTNTSTSSQLSQSSNTNGSVNGGATTVDTGSHAVDSGNSTVRVNYTPSVVPESAPSIVASANVIVSEGHCGPLQAVVHHDINGVVVGFFKNGTINLGVTDEIVPAPGAPFNKLDRMDGIEGYELYGHQVVTFASVIGLASGKNAAAGGFAGSGASGQAGLGTTNSMQRLVTTVQLVSCLYERVAITHPVTPAIALAPPVVETPTPTATVEVPVSTPAPKKIHHKAIPACK